MEDKDEDWMLHLPLDKKTFIIDNRAEILAIYEKVERLTIAHRALMTSLRDATPERKAQANREFEEKKRSFHQILNKAINDLLPALHRLKDRGLNEKARKAREEAASSSKRRRLQDYLNLDTNLESNVELVTDNYLPSHLPFDNRDNNNRNNQSRKRQKSKRNIAEEMPVLQSKASPAKNRDTFFDGVEDPLERKVLADLRSEIVKHNCRDRALKAVQSIILRDQSIESMMAIINLCDTYTKLSSA